MNSTSESAIRLGSTFRIAKVNAERSVEVVEAVLQRSLGPFQVLVQVDAVGICGSDVAVYRGHHPYKVAPAVLGHELAGTVLAIGAQVTTVDPGATVCAAAFVSCGTCICCREGFINRCRDRQNLSAGRWSGGLADAIVVHERMLYLLSPQVDRVVGALIEPLSIAHHAIKRGGLRPDTLGVVGIGGIGLAVIAVARSMGIETVAVDIDPRLEDLAVATGARCFMNGANNSEISKAEFDMVIVASEDASALTTAAVSLRPGGTVVIVGYLVSDIAFRWNSLMEKEASLHMSLLADSDDVHDVIGAVESGQLSPLPMVTHRIELEAVPDAFRLLDARAEPMGKVIVEPHDAV